MSIIHLHLGFSLLATALILAILALPKGRSIHRRLGRAAAAALVLSALSSFWISASGGFSPIHILSVITLVTVPLAVWQVRRGQVLAHKIIMLSNAGGLVVAGGFASLMPGRYFAGLLFG